RKPRALACRSLSSAAAFPGYVRATTAARDEPACILLDIRMPGMGGEALFARLRDHALGPEWPVIFLTGHGDVSMAVGAIKGGAFDFVEKPFSDNSLVEKLQAGLQESSRRLERRRQEVSLETRLATLTAREREVMDL